MTQYSRHVERLAHAELARFRYVFKCADCNYTHQEFFAVDAAVARRVVGRWVRFSGGAVVPWEAVGDGVGSTAGGTCNKSRGAKLAAPWRARLEGYAGLLDGPTPAGKEGVEAGMALWDGFVDAGLTSWVWYDVRRAAGVVWRHMLWVVVVSLAIREALWFRSVGSPAPSWVMLGLLLLVLTSTVFLLPLGSVYTWAALGKGLLWLIVVALLTGLVGRCLYLGRELSAWVLTWMLAGVLMCMVLMLMGFRCVTAEYLCRRG
jgi:hypothetical protein